MAANVLNMPERESTKIENAKIKINKYIYMLEYDYIKWECRLQKHLQIAIIANGFFACSNCCCDINPINFKGIIKTKNDNIATTTRSKLTKFG